MSKIQKLIKKSVYIFVMFELFLVNVSSIIIDEKWDNSTTIWMMSLQNPDGGFGYMHLLVNNSQPDELATYYAAGSLYLLNATPLKSESCIEWLKLKLNESYKKNRSDISDYISIPTIKKFNPAEKIDINFTNFISRYQCSEGYFFSDCNLTEDINAYISETRDALCLLKSVNYSKSLNKTLNWLISITPKNNSFDSLGMCSFIIDSYKCIGLDISSQINTTNVIDWTLSQQNDDGSFGDGNIDDTYFAVNILKSLNCTNKKCNDAIKSAISFFVSLQNPDGGFYAPGWNFNTSDMTSTYVVVNALSLVNITPKNTQKSISWILSYQDQNTKCFVPNQDLISTPQVTYFVIEYLHKAGEHPKDMYRYYKWLKSQTLKCDNPKAVADASYVIQLLNNSELENRYSEIQDCIISINKNIKEFEPITISHTSIILNKSKNQISTENFDTIKYNLKSQLGHQNVNNFHDAYYSIIAHYYLGLTINQTEKEKYLKYIRGVENHDGGFGSLNYSNMMETYAAIEALHFLNESPINVNKTIAWVLSCKKETGFPMAPGTSNDVFHLTDPVATSMAISSLDSLSDYLNPECNNKKNSIMPILMIFFIIIFAIATLFLIKKGIIKNNFVFGIFVGLIISTLTIFISPIAAFFTFTIEDAQLSIEMAEYLVVGSVITFLAILGYMWFKKYVLLAKGTILGYILMFIIIPLLWFIIPG